ncbi:MAG: PAC2 family protein [Candidatus Omnitrophota bacterium]
MGKYIKIYKRPRLKNPILIAAWPGMGDVAIKAALYLKDKLKAVEFADFLSQEYFSPSSVWVEEGVVGVPTRPVGKFYFYKSSEGARDIIIFISDAQPLIDRGYEYASQVIDFAKYLKVNLVYTFAAMPLPIEFGQTSKVHAVATKKEILDEFTKKGIKAMPTGQISGLNGLVLGVARECQMDGVCLLGEIPLYTIQVENPFASVAILSVLADVLRIKLDLSGLLKHAHQMSQEIEGLIDYLKNPSEEEKPIDQKEIDRLKKGLSNASALPVSVAKRIHELFQIARKDCSKACDLKKELDKWNVYEQYEDSFLDLFKKCPKTDN